MTHYSADYIERLNQLKQERDDAIAARDEVIKDKDALVDAFGKVWDAFPPEVMLDQLEEDYDECAEIYDKYFYEPD